MDEIVQEFLVESYENLDQLDQDLVALEGDPGSRELLSGVFRTIHTIKGTCGFLAFNRLESLTHAGESLLSELRDGRRVMDQPTTDVLLRLVDTVRAILATIEASGAEGDTPVDEVIGQLQAVLAASAMPTASAAETLVAEARETERPVANLRDSDSQDSAAQDSAARDPAAQDSAAQDPAAQDTAAQDTDGRPVSTEPLAVEAVFDRRRRDREPEPVSASDSAIRINVELLDALMRQVGELVLTRNQIARLVGGQGDADLTRASQRLGLVASELQEGVMQARMQPIGHLWTMLPRVVRDLAATCGRRVRLELVGGDTELDRALLEAVKDPLMHLVRNAVDHGIEDVETRVAAGKSPDGVLSIRAYHAGGQVIIELEDDGRGIDAGIVGATAVARGLRTHAQIAEIGEAGLIQLLFLPGFSTAKAVTNLSGRGVGLDVVRTKIGAIGGTVDVESIINRGTTWRLRIPLTLAIISALIVESAGELYAIPAVSVLEFVAPNGAAGGPTVEYVGLAPVLRRRGVLLPLVSLRSVLGLPEMPGTDQQRQRVIAVLQADTLLFGLIVDGFLDTEEIVVKPLAARLRSVGVYAGTTLLGDGRVSLILDVQGIARLSRTGPSVEGQLVEADLEPSETPSPRPGVTGQVLVVGIGDGRRVAIPLEAVTRLERVRSDVIEHVGGREVLQYRGAIVPLARLDSLLAGPTDLTGGDVAPEEMLIVIFTRGLRTVAVAAREVLDISDDDATRHSQIDDRGMVGSAVLGDRVTELLDVRQAVLRADPTFFDDDDVPDASAPDITPVLSAVG